MSSRVVCPVSADMLTFFVTFAYCTVRFVFLVVVLNCWFSHFPCGREYAPKFALRSYFFLLPSVGAARASETFLSLFGQGNDKPQVSLQKHTGTVAITFQTFFNERRPYAVHKSRTIPDAGGIQVWHYPRLENALLPCHALTCLVS